MKEEISRGESQKAQHMLQWALTDKLETPTTDGELDLPGYKVTKLLGRGGMGAVYRAEEKDQGRVVAIKVFTPSGIDADLFVERLRREGQMLAQMEHDNVVGIHDAFVLEDGVPYLVLEYIDGHDLAKRLDLDKKVIPTEALRIAIEVCAGLSAAHSLGIIHRDVKPANVLLGKNGDVKVSDFGISKGADENGVQNTQLTLTGTTLGTVDYMSPEQADGGALDARSDIYSVGVLIYEMLTGLRPRGAFDPLDKLGFPKELSRLVMRCLQRDPDKRPASAANLSQSLKKIREVMIRNKAGRKPLYMAAVGAVLAIGIVLYAAARKTPDLKVLGQGSALETETQELNKKTPATVANVSNVIEALEPGLAAESPKDSSALLTVDGVLGDWEDLMAKIDIIQHQQSGTWYKSGRRVWCSAEAGSRLAVPFRPGNDYILELDFIRDDGENAVAVFLPSSLGMVSLEIDTFGDHLAGLQELDGKDLRNLNNSGKFEIENGRLYHLRVHVAEKRVSAFLNSQKLGSWSLTNRTASIPLKWDAPRGRQLAIGAWSSHTTFTNFQIKRRKK